MFDEVKAYKNGAIFIVPIFLGHPVYVWLIDLIDRLKQLLRRKCNLEVLRAAGVQRTLMNTIVNGNLISWGTS